MKYRNGLTLALLLAAAPSAAAASKDQELPDREMLRMIEFLKEMEMIKQIELMQDLHHVDAVGDQVKNARQPKPAPAQKKETLK
ncbi:MAG: hypothetical protein HW419_2443 [Deltaproteobacteria bacterium]|nr:hypothetical protein [Deltaproteobacteria bacterium]